MNIRGGLGDKNMSHINNLKIKISGKIKLTLMFSLAFGGKERLYSFVRAAVFPLWTFTPVATRTGFLIEIFFTSPCFVCKRLSVSEWINIHFKLMDVLINIFYE